MNERTPSRSMTLLFLLLIILGGFAVRLWGLDAQPLRGDEGFSMVVWLGAFGEMFGSLATVDPQPPVALLSFFGWVGLVGDSVFAVRYQSVLANTLTIAVVFAIGRDLAGRRVGLIAAGLWALSAYQLWFAQDLRSAALWTMFSAVTVWFLLRGLKHPDRIGLWIGYVLAVVAGLYTFYLEAFLVIFHNLYVFGTSWREPKTIKRWIMVQVIAGALILPWYAQPRLYGSSYAPTAGPVKLPWAFQAFFFGDTLPDPWQITPVEYNPPGIAAWIAVGLFIVLISVIAWQQPWKKTLFVAAYPLVPLGLMTLMELLTGAGYFRVRYILASAPGWILLIALGVVSLDRLTQDRRLPLGSVVLAVVLILNVSGIRAYRFDPAQAKAPDWPALAGPLNEALTADDVLVYNYPDPAFEYYYTGEADSIVLPIAGTPAAETLDELAASHDLIWYVPFATDAWDQNREVSAWLDANAQPLISFDALSLTVQAFVPYAADPGCDTPVNVIFGDVALLTCADIVSLGPTADPGETLGVRLTWLPLAQTETDLTGFVHLTGPPRPDGSPLWAQDDHLPQRGHTSTIRWGLEQLLLDAYTLSLPPDLPPGTYQLSTGLYNPVTAERLPLTNDIPQPSPGAVLLGEITITE